MYLPRGEYRIDFLAFAEGRKISTTQEVRPFVATAGSQNNQITGANYADDELTMDKRNPQQPVTLWYCKASAEFAIDTEAEYDVGVEVDPNDDAETPRVVHIASLTCFRKPQ